MIRSLTIMTEVSAVATEAVAAEEVSEETAVDPAEEAVVADVEAASEGIEMEIETTPGMEEMVNVVMVATVVDQRTSDSLIMSLQRTGTDP